MISSSRAGTSSIRRCGSTRSATSRFPATRIAAVESNIAADATETIDARGKYVTPGLIDIHSHAGRGGAPLALSDGVTGWVDAGSFGIDGIDQAIAAAASAPNRARFLINISRLGTHPTGELNDINNVDVGLTRGMIGSIATSSSASRRACRATSPTPTISRRCGAPRRRPAIGLPVMIHVGQNYSPMRAILLAAQARRHRHPHVRAGAEQHLRRQGPRAARGARCPTPRHRVRLRQRRGRPLQLGNGGVRA